MEWNPGEKYRLYLDKITDILGEERRTVRDVYYALEARGFPSELAEHGYEFEYRYVKRAIKKGRRAGIIDPSMIFDASRPAEVESDPGHGDPETFIRRHVDGIESAYRENFWDDQPKHVEVWLEKQSLASVFQPICDEFNVRLEATRGDWSDSKVYEATQRLKGRITDGDDVRVLYFGDFNPSGLHAPVAIQQTMAHYGLDFRDQNEPDSRYFDIFPFSDPVEFGSEGGTLEFERLALNLEQVDRFDLPQNPTPSSTDKDMELRERFMTHASRGRDVNIELNALKEYEREFLEDLLRDGIEKHIDESLRQETDERVAKRKEAIGDAIKVDYSEIGDV